MTVTYNTHTRGQVFSTKFVSSLTLSLLSAKIVALGPPVLVEGMASYLPGMAASVPL